jgi:uncharacterized protein (TIGR00266 family)
MGLDFTIANRPDFATLCVRLQAGEQIFAEPGAMLSMDENIALSSGLRGGLWRSLGRALGGESVIMNTFTATQGPGEVVLAPFTMGDMVHHALTGGELLLQRGAFSACSSGVEVASQLDGLRGFFSGNGLILLRCSGNGDLFFNTYGGLIPIDVSGHYYVDTGYVVAFESTLDYEVTVMPGLSIGQRTKAFLLGGEGFVCRFSGQGRLWIQTRAVPPLLRFLDPFRPIKKIKES